MTVYFHGNFGLNRPRMADLLQRALANPELRDKELAEPVGYGPTYAQRYRSWLHKTGLIKLDFPMYLTPMGTVIWQYDPGLEKETTQWFLHWELTSDPERVETWHWFVHEFLPAHKTFGREDLLRSATDRLRSHSEKHFGTNGILTPVVVRKLIECYTQDYALGKLGLLHEQNSRFVYQNPKHVLGPWTTKEQLALSYT